eukprot:10405621-Alexandrium_andersonii.AAC.1
MSPELLLARATRVSHWRDDSRRHHRGLNASAPCARRSYREGVGRSKGVLCLSNQAPTTTTNARRIARGLAGQGVYGNLKASSGVWRPASGRPGAG